MTLRWILAALHLLALGIGLGAVYSRARLLKGLRDAARLPEVFLADGYWALAGALWLVTGLLRAFTGLEKGAAYYLHHPLFHVKLTLFVVILLLEIRPMLVLIRWRQARRRGETPDLGAAPGLAKISHAQAGLVVIILLLATAIARGLLYPTN